MKKILITGSNGLLGQKLISALASRTDIVVLGISKGANRSLAGSNQYSEVDLCDPVAVKKIFLSFQPEVVIHTAAMTNVDACELDPASCVLLNVTVTQNLVALSALTSAHFIHLSTDFIFDGKTGHYSEDDTPNPLSRYGVSKVDSEAIVRSYPYSWTIVRTILVYGFVPGLSRTNIVLWAKGALERGEKIKVVHDQFRTPTLAEDLAAACITIADGTHLGIFHVSGPDYMSILELVGRLADYFHLRNELIEAISSSTLSQPATRPANTGFNISKSINAFNYTPHLFEEGLRVVAAQLTLPA